MAEPKVSPPSFFRTCPFCGAPLARTPGPALYGSITLDYECGLEISLTVELELPCTRDEYEHVPGEDVVPILPDMH